MTNNHKSIPAVFISSTVEDLKPYREAARDAAIAANFHPVMQEFFAASDNNPPLVPRFTLFCGFRAPQIRQGKAQAVGNGFFPFQGLQRRIGVFGRLPSGKPTSSHLRCCAHLH